MKTLFLVGYMGCGKSTFARRIARRLEVEWADTDREVEQSAGASVCDLVRYEGEARFREAERAALDRLIDEGRVGVVATGGGLPVWRDNMERMNGAGLTVYLRRPAEQIACRMSPYGRQRRPRLRGLSDEELVAFMHRDMAEREAFYARAQLVFDCAAASDDELLDRIVEALQATD